MKYNDKMMEDFAKAKKDLIEINRAIKITIYNELPTDDEIFNYKFYDLEEDIDKVINDLDMIMDLMRYRGKK